MTTTWLDTPGSALSSRIDAVDFTVSADPTYVGVAFETPQTREELAYREGEFVAPYLDSTKTGSTFALRRSGGWPAEPTVMVKSAADVVAPSGPATWQRLYAVDFTTQPVQAISGPGTYIIDGKTWFLKESDVSTAQMAPYLDGGIGWAVSPSYSGTVGNFGGGHVNQPHWFFPLSQVPGYTQTMPVCVRIQPPGYWGCAGGIVHCTSDTTRHQSANAAYDALAYRWPNSGVGGKFGASVRSGSNVYTDGAIAIFELPSILKTLHAVAAVTGPGVAIDALPSPADMVVTGFGSGDTQALSVNEVTMPRANPGVMLMGYGSGMPSYPISIRGIEIWGCKS